MGLISVYSTIDRTNTEIKATGKLKDILNNNNLKNCIVLKAGERVNDDYIVTADDVLYCRVLPKASIVVGAAIFSGILGVTLGAGVALKTAQEKKKAEAQRIQEDAQKMAQNLAQQITQYPFINGAKNRSALGQHIPYLMGKMYFTPYMLTDAFYSVEGENGKDQYFNAIFALPYGRLNVNKILLGDETLIENANGITSGVHSFKSDSVYYDSKSFIELRQNGENFTIPAFTQKVIATNDGSEVKHEFDESNAEGTPVIKQIAAYTKKLEVCIQLNGLRYYDDSTEVNSWVEREIQVVPYWSNDNGATWHAFNFAGVTDNKIKLNTNHTVRFVATKEFTYEESYNKNLLLKVAKLTPKMQKNSNEDVYLAYYQSYCYDNKTSGNGILNNCEPVNEFIKNKIVRFGVKIAANENTSGNLDEFHTIINSLAPTWNGSSWSTTKSPTSNPASIIYEVLTSDVHAHSKYNLEEFDRESLGELYEYCENPEGSNDKLRCDGVITDGIKKEDLIGAILSNCFSTMYKDSEGIWKFATDKKETTPKALINAENIISVSYTKDMSRKPDGVKISYINGDSWQPDSFYLMLDGGEKTADKTATETNLSYITNYKHAARVALRMLKKQVLQPRTFTARLGREADYYPLYSTVLLQKKEFRQGIKSSSISKIKKDENGTIYQLTLSDYVTFELGKRYGLIIYAVSDNGRKLYYKEISGSGKTRDIILNDPITSDELQPELFNTVSIGYLNDEGEFNSITNVMKIEGLTPDGSNGYEVILKDYNPSIYELGDIPEYKSNITRPPKPSRAMPTTPAAIEPMGTNGNGIFYSSEIASATDTTLNLSLIQLPLTRDLIKGDLVIANSLMFGVISITDDVVRVSYLGSIKGNDGQGSANYKGVINSFEEIPSGENDYFLAGSNFDSIEYLKTTKGRLKLNGKFLVSRQRFIKGFIYTKEPNGWNIVLDRNNFRYTIALNDLYLNNAEVSPALNKVIGLGSVEYTPKYLGIKELVPANPEPNNFFMYYGESGGGFIKGSMYKYNGYNWILLNNTTENYNYYMSALADIGTLESTQEAGAFINLFAQTLAVQNALIENLNAKFLTLRNGGYMKSENYSGVINSEGKITQYGTKGAAIDTDGKADFTDLNATGGTFENVTLKGGFSSYGVPFKPIGMFIIRYENNNLEILGKNNILQISRTAQGMYTISFDVNPDINVYRYNNLAYAPVMAVGNAWKDSILNPLFISHNADRAISGVLPSAKKIPLATLPIRFSNRKISAEDVGLEDPTFAQVFIFATIFDNK